MVTEPPTSEGALKSLAGAVTTPRSRILVNILYVTGLFLPNPAAG
jgi:hypothetical protein